MIHIYGVDVEGLALTKVDPLVVAPGSGPRHLAFVVKETKTFMYLVTELANTVVGYEVVYGGGFITFREVWTSGIHGEESDTPQGAAAAEIAISVSEYRMLIDRDPNAFCSQIESIFSSHPVMKTPTRYPISTVVTPQTSSQTRLSVSGLTVRLDNSLCSKMFHVEAGFPVISPSTKRAH